MDAMFLGFASPYCKKHGIWYMHFKYNWDSNNFSLLPLFYSIKPYTAFPLMWYILFLYKIKVYKIMIFLACECSSYGSSSIACGSSGECTCNSNFTGTKCASCNTGYYNYPNCYCKIYCIIL